MWFALFNEVSEKVFSFISETGGSNVFLLKGGSELALIDSSTVDNKDLLLEGLGRLGLKPESVSLLLHTHGHADHFGNDGLFSRARIGMHEEDAKELNSGNGDFACSRHFPESRLPRVSVFLKRGQQIDLGGFSLTVLHAPGHTAGSVCFFEPFQKLLFSGDTLFSHGFGRTDLPTGNSQKMLESLKNLEKTPFEALLPGHGPMVLGREANSASLKEVLKAASTNTFL